MNGEDPLLIFGASARSAAFSALRAGIQPWCADLFADRDLHAYCAAQSIPPERYPQAFLDLATAAPDGPWMYTGGLENHPELVDRIAAQRPLWGNPGSVLRRVRNPMALTLALRDAGLPAPETRARPDGLPKDGSWLVKPRASCGGMGVEAWRGRPVSRRQYLQERIEGVPCAAVYLALGRQARLLGVTRQLVGQTWLHAGPFAYCGSIGPLALPAAVQDHFRRLGKCLASSFGLRGLFGVDCILREALPWAVEVNPRYTASVEVLEHAGGFAALAGHRQAFLKGGSLEWRPSYQADAGNEVIGKAILFASRALVFPDEGPWLAAVGAHKTAAEPPSHADIPHPKSMIEAGRPVLSFFAAARSEEDCLGRLKEIAADLDRRFRPK